MKSLKEKGRGSPLRSLSDAGNKGVGSSLIWKIGLFRVGAGDGDGDGRRTLLNYYTAVGAGGLTKSMWGSFR